MRREVIEKSPTLKSLGLHMAIDTNGTLLDSRMRETVLNCYDGIIFSVDGSKDTHDAIRGKGTFKTVLMNIEKLSIGRNESRSSLKINVNTAVSNLLSVDEVEELVQILSSLGVDSMKFVPVLHKDSIHAHRRYKPTHIECKKILEFIYGLVKKYPQIEISRKYIERILHILICNDDIKQSYLEYPICHCGKESFMIDAFGGVWPCCMFTQNDIKMGIDWKEAVKLFKDDRLSTEFEKMKRLSNQSCRTCIIPFLNLP